MFSINRFFRNSGFTEVKLLVFGTESRCSRSEGKQIKEKQAFLLYFAHLILTLQSETKNAKKDDALSKTDYGRPGYGEVSGHEEKYC